MLELKKRKGKTFALFIDISLGQPPLTLVSIILLQFVLQFHSPLQNTCLLLSLQH